MQNYQRIALALFVSIILIYPRPTSSHFIDQPYSQSTQIFPQSIISVLDHFVYLPYITSNNANVLIENYNVSSIDELIAAINDANLHPEKNAYISLSEGYYSVFEGEGYNALPLISSNITINGNGSTISRDTTAGFIRFFQVSESGKLTLQHLTLTNLNDEGANAIVSKGDLTLDHFNLNNGGSIQTYGKTLTILNSEFTNKFGSPDSVLESTNSKVNIYYSSFSDNKTDVPTRAVLSIVNGVVNIFGSEISNNSGTGIATYNSEPSVLNISHSNISENYAGIYSYSDTVKITNSQIHKNRFHAFRNDNPLALIEITESCITANYLSPRNNVIVSTAHINAEDNWWGFFDGPGGVGPGSGDFIPVEVAYDPFLTVLPVGCTLLEYAEGVEIHHNAYSSKDGRAFTFPDSQVSLDIIVTGYALQKVEWAIVSGDGSLSNTTDTSVNFHVPSSPGETIIQATSTMDPSKSTLLTIKYAPTVIDYIEIINDNYTTYYGDYGLTGAMSVSSHMNLSAIVHGIGLDDPSVIWEISSGEGVLMPDVPLDADFYSPDTPGGTMIKAISVEDPTVNVKKLINYGIYVVQMNRTYGTVLVNGKLPLRAYFQINLNSGFVAYGDDNVKWDIISGGGSFDGSAYLADSEPGKSVIRFTSVNHPSIYQDVLISTILEGPHHCENIITFSGPWWAIASFGAIPNYPTIRNIDIIDEFYPLIGQSQTVQIKALVDSPAIDPNTSAWVYLYLDNGNYGPFSMELISGDGFNGIWQGSWTFPDTSCENYQMDFYVTNGVNTRNVTPTWN